MLENKLNKIKLLMSKFRMEHIDPCDELLNTYKLIIEDTG